MSNCQTTTGPIQSWIRNKLLAKDDRAISDYIKNAGPKEMDSTRRLLRNLVEMQVIKIGRSDYLTQLFAIPVRIVVEDAQDFPNIQNLNVSALMRSMVRTNVISSKDCIVLLNGLAPHEFIETTTPSALYDIARSMFMASTSCSEMNSRHFPLGNDQINAVSLPDGRLAVQLFLIGLHRWKRGGAPAPVLSNNAATFGLWKKHAQEIIGFSSLTPGRSSPQIEIGNAAPLFQAFAEGHLGMMEFVLQQTCENMRNDGVTDYTASYRLGFALSSPTSFVLTVNFHEDCVPSPTHLYDIVLCERLGDSVTDTLGRLQTLFSACGVVVRPSGIPALN